MSTPADDYNKLGLETGDITPTDVTSLTERYQASAHLKVDGFCGPDTLAALRADHPPYVLGINVSHHDGDIDWAVVAKSGIKYAWIKTTQGTDWTDPQCDLNAGRAANAGIRIGYYHYADTTVSLAAADQRPMPQAAHFLEVVQGLPSPSLPLVLDVEKKTELSRVAYTCWLETFCGAVAGYAVGAFIRGGAMVYTSARIVERDLAPNHGLGIYPLWAPRYGPDEPVPPVGWDDWAVWQYTQSGVVPGVPGNAAGHCDINRADPEWYARLIA